MFELIEPSEKKKQFSIIYREIDAIHTLVSMASLVIFILSATMAYNSILKIVLFGIHRPPPSLRVRCSCVHCTNISKDWNFLCFILNFESNDLKWRWTRRKNKSNRTHNCRAYHVFVDQQRTILNKTNKAFVHSLNISKTRNLNVGLVFFLL